MKRLASIALFAAMLAGAVCAKNTDADWKIYGGVTMAGENQACFYDAKGVTKAGHGGIRVSTKCLADTDLTTIDIQKVADGKILQNAVKKIYAGYEPPIAKVKPIDKNQAVTFTQYEETADLGNIKPRATFLLEFDCSAKRYRKLSFQITEQGKTTSFDKPGDWEAVAPESNAETVGKLLCVDLKK